MGLVLGPLLAEILMVHLECTLIPKLTEHINPWKKYIDEPISIIKEKSITHVVTVLNNFHKNIEFTEEVEENGKIAFLDILIIRIALQKQFYIERKHITEFIYIGNLSHPQLRNVQ